MRLASAAVGLAAMGAGLLVARMVMHRRDGSPPGPAPEPPSPEQLIGKPETHLSAAEAADVFRAHPPGAA